MQIRHLRIKNFRGIKNLDWHVPGRINCLIGANDSTKTTILDAIECALSPRWRLTFSDADFYKADTTLPIEIDVTVGELPSALSDEPEKFGLYLRGYKDGAIVDEPDDEVPETVVTVRLSVDDSLEPEWTLHTDRGLQRYVSSKERSEFNVARIGDGADLHLTWGRGSALTKHGSLHDQTARVHVEMARAIRSEFSANSLPGAADVCDTLKPRLSEFGVASEGLHAGLDVRSLSFRDSIVALCRDELPLRSSGLGTRRLAGIAIQHALLSDPILLVDEIEHGLEPHRIRWLMLQLVKLYALKGQVFFTTHSPTCVLALKTECLAFVNHRNGETHVRGAADPQNLQRKIRPVPHALLSRKIIVCEGKTEVGVCRALEDHWFTIESKDSAAAIGAQPIHGDGCTKAPGLAIELSRLGYQVAYLGDTDTPPKPSPDAMKAAGVEVILWEDGKCIEQRIAIDLEVDDLHKLIELARSLDQTISSHLKQDEDVDQWRENVACEAITHKWFKDWNRGQALGEFLADRMESLKDKDLGTKLLQLKNWVYAAEPRP